MSNTEEAIHSKKVQAERKKSKTGFYENKDGRVFAATPVLDRMHLKMGLIECAAPKESKSAK